MEKVPHLAFESLNFVDDMPADTNDTNSLHFAYTLPSENVIEVVKAVAATGAILPIKPPSANASWTVEFRGPTLSCTNITQPLSSALLSNIAAAMQSGSHCEAYGYLAWLENMPFIKASNSSEYTFNSRIFQGSSMPAILYMVGFPGAMQKQEHGALPAACQQPSLNDTEAMMLQCQLTTAEYHTSFNYTNGIPEILVDTNSYDDAPIQTISSVNCTTSGTDNGTCDLTPETLRTLSYQAIMDAFTYLITGYVVTRGDDPSALIQTQVISTPLAGTKALEFISKPLIEQDNGILAKPLQRTLLDWADTRDNGLIKSISKRREMPLAETIELLFKNVTVSMMSQASLQ
jgi:hypothetical protein